MKKIQYTLAFIEISYRNVGQINESITIDIKKMNTATYS